MRGSELRAKLHAGERVYGICMEGYGQPRFPKYFADVGLDYVWLDSEHSPANRETIAWAIQAYAANGVAPIVRIPEISAARAAMMVDAGAHGVIVPYVETAEQVRTIVGAIKYRPLKGAALAAAVERAEFANPETKSYLENYNRDINLIIMIESPTGVANLPEILQVPGVDAILIGPHDLTVSHGIAEQYEHPLFEQTVEHIIDTCRAQQIAVGMHFISGSVDWALRWARRGFNFISYRGDTLFTARGIRSELHYLREQLGGTPAAGSPDAIGASGHIHFQTGDST